MSIICVSFHSVAYFSVSSLSGDRVLLLFSSRTLLDHDLWRLSLRTLIFTQIVLLLLIATSILVMGTPLVIVEIWIFCCDIFSLRYLQSCLGQSTTAKWRSNSNLEILNRLTSLPARHFPASVKGQKVIDWLVLNKTWNLIIQVS